MDLETNGTLAAAVVVATKKTALGASLLSSMVIFNDPAYLVIAGLGAFVSMASAFYDVQTSNETKKARGEECTAKLGLEMGKAFMVGAIFTVLSFMVFKEVGEEALSAWTGTGFFHKMLPSFWLLFTLALSTESVYFFSKFMSILKRKASDESK